MRVVLDTNVVVSALIWGGIPLEPIQAAVEGRIDLITSPTLLAELTEVLNRPHLKRRLQHVRGSVDEALALYGALAITVAPDTVPRAVPNDPDDDHVIAAAMAGQADLIASGDRHLLKLGTYKAIRILRPAALSSMISQSPLYGA